MIRLLATVVGLAALAAPAYAGERAHNQLDAMIAAQAQANGVPETLVRRVIVRESGYNSHLVGKGGAMGLMQIKTATARGLGYRGSASGLLDPETNLTYAVRYLAGAYRLAGGDHDRAVHLYARGYYYAAKSKGTTIDALTGASAFSGKMETAMSTGGQGNSLLSWLGFVGRPPVPTQRASKTANAR